MTAKAAAVATEDVVTMIEIFYYYMTFLSIYTPAPAPADIQWAGILVENRVFAQTGTRSSNYNKET